MLATKKWTQLSLTSKVLVAMVCGVLLGLLLRTVFPANAFVDEYIVGGLFTIVGSIFISCLKMLVVPLIFVSLVSGTCALKDVASLGRLGIKTLGIYLSTTAIAITLAIVGGILVQPGVGADLHSHIQDSNIPDLSLGQVLIGMFPSNPIHALANGESLQIIVFALLFGVSVAAAGKKGQKVSELFISLNDVMMKLVSLVMNLAPYGVFALMARIFSEIEFDAIANLLQYFVLLLAVLFIHMTVTYSIMLKLFANLNPLTFLRKMESTMVFAFSTASSNATIPVSMETVKSRMGVSNSVASFTIPLGSTVNMDGTAMMQGVATVFIAQAAQIDLSLVDYLLVIVTATLASVGTAGVPSVGLVTLTMVLQQVGLPIEGIAMILGVDRFLDMVRTAVNVTGDCAVTCVVAKSEGQLDLDVYNTEMVNNLPKEAVTERHGG